tara:strand:+ start:1544 stop:2170 length:627 start_codon:yes stop_codon:yes gene_type:complete
MQFLNEIDREFDFTPPKLTRADKQAAADKLGIDLAAMEAVISVESNGDGFRGNRPAILFERHIFYRQLADVNVDRSALMSQNPNIVNSKWGGYGKYSEQYDRLKQAIAINETAALRSCSWGLFQIMGFHAEHLGYDSVQAFVRRMYAGESEHLEAFVRFIKADKALHAALKAMDWAKFARGYNGPAYARNKYDTKLAAAYTRHKESVA